MLWLIASILSCIATFSLGYYFGTLKKEVQELAEVVKSKVDKKPEVKEAKSELIDLTDPIREALYERDKLMKKLNPDPDE